MSGGAARPSAGDVGGNGDGGPGRGGELAREPLEGLLERFAGDDPLPAAVAGMVAARAGRVEEAAVLARLRRRAVELADEDVAAYARVVAASALPEDDPDREAQLRAALRVAGGPPAELAELATQVAVLADELGAVARRDLRGDATVSATLAAGAAAGAATLARIDLPDGDDRAARAEAQARRARSAADRARER